MLTLVFNTTDEHGGAALYRDLECLVAVANASAASYSISLFQMVADLMRQANRGLSEVELFAVANGPGSFTGIRVGVAAAQAWGTAFSRPVLGVSVLEAMVEEAEPGTRLAAPVSDARRGEFFISLFERASSSGDLSPHGEALLLKREAAVRFLREASSGTAAPTITCVAREHDGAALSLRDQAPDCGWRTVAGPLLHGIARVALRARQRGTLQSPADLDALYIRSTDAEMKWRE